MRWALTGQKIKSSEVLQILHKHQENIHAESKLWLSKAQAKSQYRLQCHGGITIPAKILEKRTVYSITEFSLNEKKKLLRMQPPPSNNESKWLILTKEKTESLTWVAATLKQYFQASIFAQEEGIYDKSLLIDAKVAFPQSLFQQISLFNVQETSNPFLIDNTLEHRHFITGNPLSPIVSSALSTVWLQFNYTSMKWLPKDDINSITGISILPGQEPHCIYDLDPIDFIHLYETEDEQQKQILNLIPNWVLLKSIKQPIIFFKNRWLTWRQLNLDEDLKLKRNGNTALHRNKKQNSEVQHDIWIHYDHSSNYTGVPIRRHIVKQLLFYNSSQLLV